LKNCPDYCGQMSQGISNYASLKLQSPMTLELEIHEEPFTGKLTNLLRGFCYVVRCEKEIPRDARYADGIQAMG
jgi:hypothetical protein